MSVPKVQPEGSTLSLFDEVLQEMKERNAGSVEGFLKELSRIHNFILSMENDEVNDDRTTD